MFASLRSRLLLLLLLIALPAFGFTLNAYLAFYREVMIRIEQDAYTLVQLAAKDQETVTAETRLLLSMLAQTPIMRDPQPATVCNQWLAALLQQHTGYTNLGAADRAGNLYCSGVPAPAPINFRDRAWFQKAAASHNFLVSDYQIGRITGKPGIVFGYPLRGPDDELTGVLFAFSNLTWLQRLVSTVQLPAGSTATVIGPDGRILARFPDPEPWVGKTLPDALLVRLIRDQPGPGFTELTGLDGVQRFYAYAPLVAAGGSVYLLVGLSRKAALDSLRQTLTSLTLLGLMTLAGLAAAWWGISVLLVRPIGQLTDAVHQLGASDFSAGDRLDHLHWGTGELRDLAVSFNEMAAGLEQQNAARQAVAERFQQLLNAAPLPLCSVNTAGNLRYINYRFTETFGYTLADVPTIDDWWRAAYPDPDYRQQVIAAWSAAVRTAAQTRTDIKPAVYQITGKNGQTRLIEISGVLLGDELLAMFLDITERRLTEAALHRREQEFKRLLDAAPLPLCSLSQEGALLYINDRFIKTFGYTLADVPTIDDWWRVVCPDPDYRQWAAATWERTVRYHQWAAATWDQSRDDAAQLGVDLAPFEYQIVSKNGQIRQLEISGVILGDEVLALFMDVTERRQAEAALRRREQEFKNLAEHSPDLIARFDRSLRHLYISPLILAMTGREPAEFIGKTNRELGFDPALAIQWDAAIQQVLATGQEQQLDFCLPSSTGQIQYFEARLAPECAEDGALESVLSVTRNITARKAAEDALRLNEERLNSLLDLNQKAHSLSEKAIIDLAVEEAVRLTRSEIGYFHFVNEDQQTIRLFTWSKETLKHCQVAVDDHYPINQAGVWADSARLRRPVIHNDYQNLPNKKGYPEGHSHLIRHMSAPVLDNDRVMLIVGVGNKIGDYDEADARQLYLVANEVWKIIRRKKVDDELRQSREHYHRLFMDTQAVGLLIDPDSGAIVDANRMAVRYYGYSLEQLQQLKISDINILPPEAIARQIQSAIDEGRDCFQFQHRLASGEIRDVEVYSGPVEIDGKTLLYSIIQDITARNRVTAEREALHRQLVDASRLAGMTEVATGVLHNVGNVLNSVNVSAHLISDGLRASRLVNLGKTVQLLRESWAASPPDHDNRSQRLLSYLAALAEHLQDEQQQLYAEVQAVTGKIDHIKRIVSRQQTYAISSGVSESIPLPQLLDDALAMNIADHHTIAIIREYAPLPAQVLDKHKLLQIVTNLIQNAKQALKEQGSRRRRLIARIHPIDTQRLHIEIADNGAGIAPEHLNRVFEFGFTTKPNGHGFGLHISANLAHELGGQLTCRSAGLGQGAAFTLELPCRPEILLTTAPAAAISAPGY